MNIRERAEKASKKKSKSPVKRSRTNIQDIERSIIWKPTEIPEGFILKVDTREQTPLFDPIPKGLCIVRDTVTVGDYTVKGFEDKLAIERKGLSDFFSYIGSERDRTVKKLERMSEMYFSALVVQVEECDLYSPFIPTKLSHEHVRGFLKCLRVKYRIPYIITDDKDYIERYILDSLTYAFSHLREVR